MTTNASDKNDSAVRPRTVFLGTDDRGYDYYLKTERPDTDVVRVFDGRREVVYDELDGLRVKYVMATVADEIGWADPQYGHWGRDSFPCKHA